MSARKADPRPAPTLVKRYGAGRLYDTVAARYATPAELQERQRAGEAIAVRDATTGADITECALPTARAGGRGR